MISPPGNANIDGRSTTSENLQEMSNESSSNNLEMTSGVYSESHEINADGFADEDVDQNNNNGSSSSDDDEDESESEEDDDYDNDDNEANDLDQMAENDENGENEGGRELVDVAGGCESQHEPGESALVKWYLLLDENRIEMDVVQRALNESRAMSQKSDDQLASYFTEQFFLFNSKPRFFSLLFLCVVVKKVELV